jgi:hypothetical protein
MIFVAHRGSKAGEAIGHDLHAGAVVKNVEITLVEAAELGNEVDGASVLVVAEEVVDAAPDGVGGVGVLGDHGEKLGVDAVVKPRDYGAVILHPSLSPLAVEPSTWSRGPNWPKMAEKECAQAT